MGHLRVAGMTAGHRGVPQPVASDGNHEHREQHRREHPHHFRDGPQTGHTDGKCCRGRGDDPGSHDGGEPIGPQTSEDLWYRPVVRAHSCHELKTLLLRVGVSGRSRVLVQDIDLSVGTKPGMRQPCCTTFDSPDLSTLGEPE